MEVNVLHVLGWSLAQLTPMQFLDFYLTMAVHREDLHEGDQIREEDLEHVALLVEKAAHFFVDLALHGIGFGVSAACKFLYRRDLQTTRSRSSSPPLWQPRACLLRAEQ